MPEVTVQEADPVLHAGACAAIYAPYVRDTAVSFEEAVPSAAAVADRIRAALVWLVAEADGRVVGYAYGSPHRERAAYRWAADVSVYVGAGTHRQGVARTLYTELFTRLRAAGIRTLCAGATQPNPASNGLHEAMGFTVVGTYRRIGWKNGAWHDVRWYQLQLAPDDASAPV